MQDSVASVQFNISICKLLHFRKKQQWQYFIWQPAPRAYCVA